jgi:DNA invertase Pin-like site-specific DNA recombinase
MGRAGIVLGLEVSRLARNNADWHRLLEICALSGTLILDEDGLYDPCTFNDRLLLGLKGTMSEAELHLLKARLRGGILSKARRGELIQPLPVGLVHNGAGKVVLDPDTSVQQAVRHLFTTFAATGSAHATVKAFNQQQLRFPRRIRTGERKDELVWGPLTHCRVLQVLHNPRYAGAFVYGRHTETHGPGGKTTSQPADAAPPTGVQHRDLHVLPIRRGSRAENAEHASDDHERQRAHHHGDASLHVTALTVCWHPSPVAQVLDLDQ